MTTIHQQNRKEQMKTSVLLTIGLLAGSLTASAQFNSGSTGTVALTIRADTTLNLPPDGILHYTTITVESNATLRFNRNSNNTPVYLLASGDVTITGTIDVSGGNATTAAPFEPGKGGPGGFDGGWPGFSSVTAGDGQGPGGGKAGEKVPGDGAYESGGYPYMAGAGAYASQARNYFDDGFGNFGGYGSTNKGSNYGSRLVAPLAGGSGGGGANGTPGIGGGGGGGAILIASSSRITISGVIRADGGDGQTFLDRTKITHLNPGSGGAIRLVAPVVDGRGTVSANGPANGNAVNNYGRVRIDSIDKRELSRLSIAADWLAGNYMVVFPFSNRLDLINVAGTNIVEGSGPVTIQLPNGSPTSQPVTVQARNFNSASLAVQIAVAPQNGRTIIYNATINNSAGNDPGTVTTNVVIPVSTPVTVSAWTKVLSP